MVGDLAVGDDAPEPVELAKALRSLAGPRLRDEREVAVIRAPILVVKDLTDEGDDPLGVLVRLVILLS